MSHDEYCPSRMGSRCECVLIEAVRADGWEKAAQRVRDLHNPIYKGGWMEAEGGAFYCSSCVDVLYPCPTIKALDGEQG